MISYIKRLFEDTTRENRQNADSQETLIACLALLIEVSKSDHDIDPQEIQQIVTLAGSHFNVAKEQQSQLLKLAKSLSKQATSLYEYTSLVNEQYSDDEKYSLILAMWKVAFADGRIDRYEEHLIRRVADLIYIPHIQFIQAKHDALEARQRLTPRDST